MLMASFPLPLLSLIHKHTGWSQAASCYHEATGLEGRPRESQKCQPLYHFAAEPILEIDYL